MIPLLSQQAVAMLSLFMDLHPTQTLQQCAALHEQLLFVSTSMLFNKIGLMMTVCGTVITADLGHLTFP